MSNFSQKCKVLVNWYITKYAINLTIPIVLEFLIAVFFYCEDKFYAKSIECNTFHLRICGNTVIQKYSCELFSDIVCALDELVFLCNVINADCYSWMFKMHTIASGIEIGVYNIYKTQCTTIDISHYTDGDMIEIILDFEQKCVNFLLHNNKTKSIVKIHYFEHLQHDDYYVAGIHFMGDDKMICNAAKIQLIDSGYIDSPKYC